MVVRKIIWSARANSELVKILEFYTERNQSKTYSLKLLKQFQKSVVQLQKKPNLGRPTKHKNIRVLVVKEYLLFYLLRENELQIVSVWDNRQDIKRRNI